MTSKEDRPLTLKQENFCQYYVDIEGNASEAYRMAYNASKMKVYGLKPAFSCQTQRSPKG